MPGKSTFSARLLPIVMIRPPDFMCRAATCDPTSGARVFTANSRSISSSVRSFVGVPIAALQALPGVGSVAGVMKAGGQGNELSVYAERAGETLPAILRALEQAGRVPVDIRLTPPSLETLFVSLTGRKLE